MLLWCPAVKVIKPQTVIEGQAFTRPLILREDPELRRAAFLDVRCGPLNDERRHRASKLIRHRGLSLVDIEVGMLQLNPSLERMRPSYVRRRKPLGRAVVRTLVRVVRPGVVLKGPQQVRGRDRTRHRGKVSGSRVRVLI